MTHIKKWTITLGLLLMIVHTNNVNAQSYVADDNYIISSNYHDFFRHYFGEDKSYQYFSYRCSNDSYNRNCYYGIDSDNNYIKIEYEDTGNGFSFANYNAHEMLGAIRYALQTLQSPKRKHGLIQRAMESDNSFAKSAKIYLDMYNSVL